VLLIETPPVRLAFNLVLTLKKGQFMFGRVSFTVLALGIGIAVGCLLSHTPNLPIAHAQEASQLLIQGNGRAISSVKPSAGEQFTFTASNATQTGFKVVPAGKKFVLTDVMYIAQGSVRQDLVVNIANAYPAIQKHDILFQAKLSPGGSDQFHLCSGYVIPAGNALIAFTNAGLEPEQYVSVSVTGFLTDE
jgi:hypothetical protein